MIMNRIRIIGIFILTLMVIAPEAALAGWQLYFTGQAQRMFGAGGRGNFATRSQCEAYRSSSAGFERNNSYCSGFDTHSYTPSYTPPAQSRPSGDGRAEAREQEKQRQLQLQREQKERELELARQKKFAEEKDQLLGTLKGEGEGGTLSLKSGDSAALPLKGSSPERAVASEGWTAVQCQIAQRRVDVYRNALRQTVEVAQRFNRTIAADQALRGEWENTMTVAVERAKNRGQFLWLALPLAELKLLNATAAKGLNKNAADSADLLAGTTDPGTRENIRIFRQFLAREKEVVGKLGNAYKNIEDAKTLSENALLMAEDPEKSPTSPFKGDGMKLREAGEMLFGLIVERALGKIPGRRPFHSIRRRSGGPRYVRFVVRRF
jgi:hypothetical protein